MRLRKPAPNLSVIVLIDVPFAASPERLLMLLFLVPCGPHKFLFVIFCLLCIALRQFGQHLWCLDYGLGLCVLPLFCLLSVTAIKVDITTQCRSVANKHIFYFTVFWQYINYDKLIFVFQHCIIGSLFGSYLFSKSNKCQYEIVVYKKHISKKLFDCKVYGCDLYYHAVKVCMPMLWRNQTE